MFLSMWLYATQWGWKFAVGFVLLIFIHECGHLIAARHFGLKVSAPMFIPFVGALILLKESPRNAWIESCVGIGGPLLGTLGSLVCYGIYLASGQLLFAGLAFSGFFLNLFNLAPVGFLDGGRIVTAISPWLWIVGVVCLAGMLFLHFNIIVLVILVMSVPRLVSLFRKKSVEEKRYFEIEAWQRVIMSLSYFGLIVALLFGMKAAHLDPRTGEPPVPAGQETR
jgi:Zn-dependent protease